MLTVIIKDNGENNVVKLTYENLWRELKDIADAQLLVSKHWFNRLSEVKSRYVCFVEADCLVSSGYFSSMLGLFKKDPRFRQLAMLTSSTAVNNWANKFYGYSIGDNYTDGLIPNKTSKSSSPYAVQVGYVPGAIIRVPMLKTLLSNKEAVNGWDNDLRYLSSRISLGFWNQGSGKGKSAGAAGMRTHINPNATYVTTEDYVNDILSDNGADADIYSMFKKESI